MGNTENRKIFFLAVNTGYTHNGTPEQRFIDFYAERSGKGLYCAIVGNVAIPNGFGTNSTTPRMENTRIWNKLAEEISKKGTLPGIQLSTTWENYIGAKSFIARTPAEQLDSYRHIASNFNKDYVIKQFSSLSEATNIAIDSGFKHIQLHAAHGYFFNLILDNRFSNHHELAIDLTQEWVKSTGQSGIETSVRLSSLTGFSKFDSIQNSFIRDITEIPFSYHDISEGFYNINKQLIYPSLKKILTARLDRSINIALKHPKNKFIVSGKSYTLRQDTLPPNIHIGICRDLIANPNFLLEQDKGCKNKMKCHYYSRGYSSMSCGQWKQEPENL